MSSPNDAATQDLVDSVAFWWHSIDLGGGVVTPGSKTTDMLRDEVDALQLPDLGGKTVLDVGSWDGFFAFEAERRGAARVVALDHFVWSLDLERQQAYWHECRERGVTTERYEDVPGLWQPDALPGRRGFDVAHTTLGSSVEAVVADFMTTDLDRLGTFDVVLYLGVLYHMRDPLGALERLARVTNDVAVIESQAIALPALEHRPFCEFYETNELNDDSSNWWSPNLAALTGMCRAAGFARVDVLVGPPALDPHVQDPVLYRAVVHAHK